MAYNAMKYEMIAKKRGALPRGGVADYEKVSNIMNYHTDIKHIRGGESTKRKFFTRNV